MESMFIHFIHVSLYSISPMQTFCINSKELQLYERDLDAPVYAANLAGNNGNTIYWVERIRPQWATFEKGSPDLFIGIIMQKYTTL